MDGRLIITDTETTGISWRNGHRLVEIACLEMIDGVLTGERFHSYLDPLRDIDPDAVRVHGLTLQFLKGKPLFEHIADEFLAFVGDAPLVAHNATFDLGFYNKELADVGRPTFAKERSIDTLKLARERFPGQKNSLDALAKRFNVSNSERDLKSGNFHGALVDAKLLSEIYIALIGGRQRSLELIARREQREIEVAQNRQRQPRPHSITPEERARHLAFIKRTLKNPVWDVAALESEPLESAS